MPPDEGMRAILAIRLVWPYLREGRMFPKVLISHDTVRQTRKYMFCSEYHMQQPKS